jgi:hypothetical protein
MLTKCDLVKGLDTGDLDVQDLGVVRDRLTGQGKFRRLNQVFLGLLEEYSLGKFLMVSAGDEDSVENAVAFVNNVINFGDDLEPRDQDYLGLEMADADRQGGGGGDGE